MTEQDTTSRPRARRKRPRMGDALVVSYGERKLLEDFWAAVAQCECGEAAYSAVSHSADSCRRNIYRKHARHLPACKRQAELFALDIKPDAAAQRLLKAVS